MVAYFRGGVLIGVQLKRHNLGQLMEFISGNSRHTKDVLIVGQFWWWTYEYKRTKRKHILAIAAEL